jgi:hypothetical protein
MRDGFRTANQLAFCLLAFAVRRISKSQLTGWGPKFAWLGSRSGGSQIV